LIRHPDGRTVTIVGDVLHSRVARSNIELLITLGARIHLVAPPTLLPWGVQNRGRGPNREERGWPVTVGHDLDAALPGTDAVMMLQWSGKQVDKGGSQCDGD